MNPFDSLYTVEFVLLIVCLTVYYKAAQIDDAPPWLWLALSAGVYFLTWQWLRWGWFGCLIGQILLGLAIAVTRVARDFKTRK